jgi:hypothetical protein
MLISCETNRLCDFLGIFLVFSPKRKRGHEDNARFPHDGFRATARAARLEKIFRFREFFLPRDRARHARERTLRPRAPCFERAIERRLRALERTALDLERATRQLARRAVDGTKSRASETTERAARQSHPRGLLALE